jgi:hypothetical protein
MQDAAVFSLEGHTGAVNSRPLRSRVFINGFPTETFVPGFSLLHAFSGDWGHLLITDFDCPVEETTSFVLLEPESLRVAGERQFYVLYGSYTLESVEWLDENNAEITFDSGERWLLTVAPPAGAGAKAALRFERIVDQEGDAPG